MPRVRIAFRGLVLLACIAGAPPTRAATNGIAITGPSGTTMTLTTAEILKLPSAQTNVSFGTDHGKLQASFEGPLLWIVLKDADALPARPSATVREVVLVTGRDGYVAAIALGEISSAFEAKKVILAEQMNGKPLGDGHLRVVVPGDARGGRSVKDVVKITVVEPHGP